MNSTIGLLALLERVPNATITVQLSDLNAFARRLIADTREEYEQEISDRLLAIKENYLTADTVKDVLQISETTLWRWAKAGYLLPVMIGGQKRYKQSDIEKMVEQDVSRKCPSRIMRGCHLALTMAPTMALAIS